MLPTPKVLATLVDQLDGMDMADRDTKSDLHEHMLGKIATAGQNAQFRTPRQIIGLVGVRHWRSRRGVALLGVS